MEPRDVLKLDVVNGFGETEVVEVQDAPWPSLYGSVGAEVVSIGSIATL